MFGISPRKLVLYALAILGLLALNLWQFAPGQTSHSRTATSLAPIVGDLPELTALGPDAVVPDSIERDLFRPDAEPVAPPPVEIEPEPVAAPPAPPPDPRELAIKEADNRLKNMSLVGSMSGTEGMVALIENQGKVMSIGVGDELIPGFVVGRITLEGVSVLNKTLGIRRELRMGPQGEN